MMCPRRCTLWLLVCFISVFRDAVVIESGSICYAVKGGLARAHSAMGRKDNAMALISESMEIKIQYLPARHPDIARC